MTRPEHTFLRVERIKTHSDISDIFGEVYLDPRFTCIMEFYVMENEGDMPRRRIRSPHLHNLKLAQVTKLDGNEVYHMLSKRNLSSDSHTVSALP
jgi:hypothetical protein